MKTSLEKLPDLKRDELELDFFLDIKNEGILLYDSKRYGLTEPKELTPEEYKEKAQKYYEHWFESANEFFIDYKAGFARNSFKKAAFELHQATERYYSAILLVLTDYNPKTHDLEKLGNLAPGREPKLLEVFPLGTAEERNRFELLRKAYA